jgi:predicted transcriptional regulator
LEECARSITQAVKSNGQQESSISVESAFELARKLSPEARQEVVAALSGNVAPAMAEVSQQEVPPPTSRDLRLVALAQAIP